MYQIIDGKKISQEIKDELREKVTALKGQGKQRRRRNRSFWIWYRSSMRTMG